MGPGQDRELADAGRGSTLPALTRGCCLWRLGYGEKWSERLVDLVCLLEDVQLQVTGSLDMV